MLAGLAGGDVTPGTGLVSSDALTTNYYFDLRGYQIAESNPGGLSQKAWEKSRGVKKPERRARSLKKDVFALNDGRNWAEAMAPREASDADSSLPEERARDMVVLS